MLFIDNLNTIPHDGNSLLTMGTYDGIHRGHQAILQQLIGESCRNSARSILLTFEPHPQTVINPKRIPDIRILTTIEEKRKILSNMGLDLLICAPFDEAMAAMHAEDFVRDILLKKIGFKKIIIGHDHAFGKNRSGHFETLQRMSRHYDFEVEQVDAVTFKNKIINSTGIRRLLFEGKMETANEYLGRPYSISGTVVHGDGRGQKIGIPTANILPGHFMKLIPKTGVYGTYCMVDDVRHASVTNVGFRPTFTNNEDQPVIETHIFDYHHNIYGKTVVLEFLTYLRHEKHFSSKEALIKAINEDKNRFREYLHQI